MKKRLLAIIAIISMGLSLSACQIFETKTDDGKVDGEKLEDGIYVLTKDGEFIKPNTENQNFEEIVETADKSRITWSTNNNKTIPTLYKDDKLVYFSMNAIPESFHVEQFKSSGYTLGIIGMSQMTTGGVAINQDNIIKGSSAGDALQGVMSNSDSVAVYALDGEAIKANSKMFNRANAFANLKKGSKHTISIYAGTHYGEVDAIADTKVWTSYLTTTTAGYARTKEGYVEVLYGDLEDGYYSFEGTGLIRIDTKNKRP